MEAGAFTRASAATIGARRKVKVRRKKKPCNLRGDCANARSMAEAAVKKMIAQAVIIIAAQRNGGGGGGASPGAAAAATPSPQKPKKKLSSARKANRLPSAHATFVKVDMSWLRDASDAESYTLAARPSSVLPERYRTMLVDWLVEVYVEFGLAANTLYLAVCTLDRYLVARNGVINGDARGVPGKLQLLGCACMFVAAPIGEREQYLESQRCKRSSGQECEEDRPDGGLQHVPKPDDFVYIADSAFTEPELLAMAEDVRDALDRRLNVATVKLFHRRCLRACRATNLGKFLGVYLMELTLLSGEFSVEPPDLVAAASVFLARATLRVRAPTFKLGCPSTNPRNKGGARNPAASSPMRAPWTPTLHHHSGYSEANVRPMAERLRALHEKWSRSVPRPSDQENVRPAGHVPVALDDDDDADPRVVGATGIVAKAVSGKWWPVTITRVHADGCFDVVVHDGQDTRWSRMPSINVRVKRFTPAIVRSVAEAVVTSIAAQAVINARKKKLIFIVRRRCSPVLLRVAEIRPLTRDELARYDRLPQDERRCRRTMNRWDQDRCVGRDPCKCVKHGHEILGRPPWEPPL